MDASVLFIILTITLLCSSFSLGGGAYLFIRYRTRVLRLVLIFLLSLLFITLGFWTSRLAEIISLPGETGFDTASWLFQLTGSGANILVLPHFTAALVSVPLGKPVKILLWVWNTLFIILALSVFLFPDFSAVPRLLSLQLVLTILATLVFMALSLRRVKKIRWRGALTGFLFASMAFLVLLILDMLITLVPIRALAWFDNLSLPIYLAALTVGIFFFAGRFLSREAMIKAGKITGEARSFYSLTDREAEIVEKLLEGNSNKEIGEMLFISPKTVENHLYNIYRKMDVASRTQLIGTLRSWEREE